MSQILVVDDSAVDRRLAAGLLRNRGFDQIVECESGRLALDFIESERVDAVVTDLVMPNMSGASLIRELRVRNPIVPVVLMTAHHDSSTAIRALKAGAVSYVPKSQQAHRLADTVSRVVLRAATERSLLEERGPYDSFCFTYAIQNCFSHIATMVNTIHRSLVVARLGDPIERMRVSMAVEEALLNAMLHGNLRVVEEDNEHNSEGERCTEYVKTAVARSSLPQFQNRQTRLSVAINRASARFVVRDAGGGFQYSQTLPTHLSDYFEFGRCRGMMLMHSMMDHVHFNRNGNMVTMSKDARAFVHTN